MVFTNDNIKQLLAGGISGCCAKFCIAPLDRTKILLQAQHPNYRQYGVFQCVYEIAKKEGTTSLWKGTTMMMVRVFPYSAIQFFAFEKSKVFYSKAFGERRFNNFYAGSTAGVSAALCTYPLDLLRARLAYQIRGDKNDKGVAAAFKTIYHSEGGFRGFYKGISPTIIGMVPYAGVSFYTFNTLKETLLAIFPGSLARRDANDTLVLKTWVNLLTGGFAGALSQTVSFPMDVARRRMQLAHVLKNPEAYKSCWSTLKYVYQKEGVYGGLFRGLSINYLRVVPQQAIAYTTYEYAREQLGLIKKPKH